MLNVAFVAAMALGLFALVVWGVRTLPAERWQMLAAVPISKSTDGSWKGVNLTFYGFFSSTGIAFGFAMMLLLLASVGIPVTVSIALLVLVLLVCVRASRVIAGIVEHKRNTFTIAGAAFVATILLPLLVLALRPLSARVLHSEMPFSAILAAAAIAYVLAESIGRLACLSFGCCYGMPLRHAHPAIARLFRNHNLVIRGAIKKAAYASGFDGEPLIPVQAITSLIFVASGLAGLVLFLAQRFRLAALLPLIASWGWRACSESLRADYRGSSRISMYQVMALISVIYLSLVLLLTPTGSQAAPNLAAALSQVFSVPVLLVLQTLWLVLFFYYGRSRVTASTLSFHLLGDRI
ncbi:MAG: prolipoprotein diacylglyceryl transferase family protein [Candidatus Korobacteraceae bacterium]